MKIGTSKMSSENNNPSDEISEQGVEAQDIGKNEVYCRNCGEKIRKKAEICPECGVNLQKMGVGGKDGINQPYCWNCGDSIDPKAEICPDCGVQQPTATSEDQANKEKDPMIALIASIFLPGLGQLYNGQIIKAIVFFMATMVNIFLAFFGVGIITGLATLTIASYDAHNQANKINSGEVS